MNDLLYVMYFALGFLFLFCVISFLRSEYYLHRRKIKTYAKIVEKINKEIEKKQENKKEK